MHFILEAFIVCLFLCLCQTNNDDIHNERHCRTVLGIVNPVWGIYQLNISSSFVTVTCINDSTLSGHETVECNMETGNWIPSLPWCLVNCPCVDSEPLIVSTLNALGVWTNDRNRTSGHTATVHCVSSGYIVDGSNQITCHDDRKWYPDPKALKCKVPPPPPDTSLLTILSIACPSALVLVVCFIVVGKIILHIRQKSTDRKNNKILAKKEIALAYRVWTVGRVHKKVFAAVDLRSLKFKACKMFDKDNRYTTLVLEEDGTEIPSSSAMILSNDKTFMVLSKEEKWKPSFNDKSDVIKLTYDVCSSNHSKRDLFLARSLSDLLSQVSSSFREEIHCVCLEVDGTVIDDDVSLNAVAGQQLISLKSPEDWTPVSEQRARGIPLIRIKQLPLGQQICYKVWTENQRKKLMIFASDLVDLHIKASTAFSLRPPIEIKFLDDDTPIINNDQLKFHRHHVLTASESRGRFSVATPSIYSENDRISYAILPDVSPYYHSRQLRHNSTRDTYF